MAIGQNCKVYYCLGLTQPRGRDQRVRGGPNPLARYFRRPDQIRYYTVASQPKLINSNVRPALIKSPVVDATSNARHASRTLHRHWKGENVTDVALTAVVSDVK